LKKKKKGEKVISSVAAGVLLSRNEGTMCTDKKRVSKKIDVKSGEEKRTVCTCYFRFFRRLRNP